MRWNIILGKRSNFPSNLAQWLDKFKKHLMKFLLFLVFDLKARQILNPINFYTKVQYQRTTFKNLFDDYQSRNWKILVVDILMQYKQYMVLQKSFMKPKKVSNYFWMEKGQVFFIIV